MGRRSRVVDGRRVCARPECPHAGEWQPISAFPKVKTKDGRIRVYPYCYACKNRKQRPYSRAHYARYRDYYQKKARDAYQPKGRRGSPVRYPIVNGRKRCSRCHQWKRVVETSEGPPEFHKGSARIGGFHGWCKTCREESRQEKLAEKKGQVDMPTIKNQYATMTPGKSYERLKRCLADHSVRRFAEESDTEGRYSAFYFEVEGQRYRVPVRVAGVQKKLFPGVWNPSRAQRERAYRVAMAIVRDWIILVFSMRDLGAVEEAAELLFPYLLTPGGKTAYEEQKLLPERAGGH